MDRHFIIKSHTNILDDIFHCFEIGNYDTGHTRTRKSFVIVTKCNPW